MYLLSFVQASFWISEEKEKDILIHNLIFLEVLLYVFTIKRINTSPWDGTMFQEVEVASSNLFFASIDVQKSFINNNNNK